MTIFAYENILKRIPHKLIKISNNDVKCKCISPSHRDDTPSLTITDKPDRVLIHCFGCSGDVDTILSGIGLNKSSLYDRYWDEDIDKNTDKYVVKKSNLEMTLDYLKNPKNSDPDTIQFTKKFELSSDEIQEFARILALHNNKFLRENENNLEILDRHYNNFEILSNLYANRKE